MRVVVAGGGTAGHVNPAIALAQALTSHDLIFVGTRGGAEARLVPAAGFPLEFIDVRGFDRARPWSLVATATIAARAFGRSRALLRRIRPDIVVGMGGYVSLPVSLAARTARIPIVIHEQNIVFGLANRVIKPLAGAVAVSFEQTLSDAGPRGVYTGNPVRDAIRGLDVAQARPAALQRFGLDPARRTLLVFGGSQGARTINRAAEGLRRLWADRDDLQVLHIRGTIHGEPSTVAETGPLIYTQVDFVEQMTDAYAVADLALCRAGATTVAELTVVGIPALVVPYPYHRDRQQELHGRALEQAGAAAVVRDDEASAERIAAEAGRLLGDDEALKSMSKAALAFGRPSAADDLAGVVVGAAS